MKNFESLNDAVNFYQKALTSFKANRTEAAFLRVILTRSEVQKLLHQEVRMSAGMIEQLTSLDLDLELELNRIIEAEEFKDWDYWRRIVQPTPAEWWWEKRPITLKKHWWENCDWFWTGCTLVFLTISVSFATDAASRFLSGGFDFLSALTIVVPSVLALLTSGKLTKMGQDARKYLFTRCQIKPRFWELVSFSISLLLLLSLFAFHQSYGAMAVCFDRQGKIHYEANRLDSALSDYRRAISLKPNYAQAHYHLGLLYEDLQKFKEAKTEYQLAVENGADSPTSLPMLKARNNLGRLYLLEKKYDLAFPPLLEVEEEIDEELVQTSNEYKKLRYKSLKNLGWTHLGLGNTTIAQRLLEKAIKLSENQAASYCLLAQVQEKQQQPKLALNNWEKCSIMTSNFKTNPEEYRWQNIAREKLVAQRKMQ